MLEGTSGGVIYHFFSSPCPFLTVIVPPLFHQFPSLQFLSYFSLNFSSESGEEALISLLGPGGSRCRIKVGAIDVAALGPFMMTDQKKKSLLCILVVIFWLVQFQGNH